MFFFDIMIKIGGIFMPSWGIHLAIAKEVNKVLPFFNPRFLIASLNIDNNLIFLLRIFLNLPLRIISLFRLMPEMLRSIWKHS